MAKLGTKGPKPKNPFDIKKFGKKDKNLKITWQPKIVEAVAGEDMKDALKIEGKPHSSPEGRFMSKIKSRPLEIKMEAMTSEQASLNAYQNTVFYKPKNIYLDQLNIFDNRQIYPNTNLASYTQNDKIDIKARKLNEINIKKQKLLYELEMLKNEKS